MKLYDTVEKGQLRRWKFCRGEEMSQVVDQESPREGKTFLVMGVDGIRCDTMQENGYESFYVQWLITNSVPVN